VKREGSSQKVRLETGGENIEKKTTEGGKKKRMCQGKKEENGYFESLTFSETGKGGEKEPESTKTHVKGRREVPFGDPRGTGSGEGVL